VPRKNPPAISPCFIKGIDAAIKRTKGMIAKDFLIIKVTGTLEIKTKIIISKPYKKKVLNKVGLVKIIERISVKKLIILILGLS